MSGIKSNLIEQMIKAPHVTPLGDFTVVGFTQLEGREVEADELRYVGFRVAVWSLAELEATEHVLRLQQYGRKALEARYLSKELIGACRIRLAVRSDAPPFAALFVLYAKRGASDLSERQARELWDLAGSGHGMVASIEPVADPEDTAFVKRWARAMLDAHATPELSMYRVTKLAELDDRLMGGWVRKFWSDRLEHMVYQLPLMDTTVRFIDLTTTERTGVREVLELEAYVLMGTNPEHVHVLHWPDGVWVLFAHPGVTVWTYRRPDGTRLSLSVDSRPEVQQAYVEALLAGREDAEAVLRVEPQRDSDMGMLRRCPDGTFARFPSNVPRYYVHCPSDGTFCAGEGRWVEHPYDALALPTSREAAQLALDHDNAQILDLRVMKEWRDQFVDVEGLSLEGGSDA